MKKLDENITILKGIGEKTAPLYNKLGLFTLDDVIHYFPRDYMIYEPLSDTSMGQAVFEAGKIYSIKVSLIKRPLVKKVKRLNITSAIFAADGISFSAVWFHMPYLNKALTVGSEYVLRGRLTLKGDKYHFEQPTIFKPEEYNELSGKINPVYALTKGLSNNALKKTVKNTFDALDETEYEEELKEIHFPKDDKTLFKARNKLVFDEFLLFILKIRLLKESNDESKNNFNIIEPAECNRIIESLPYRLTNAQKKVWEEIKEDLTKNKSMSRLVQGDVGSGKTILAILSAIMTAVNGYQAAVMAPTEILATQHFENFCKIIKNNNLNLNPVLLTGSMTSATKRKIREKIESGEANIIIGTHALIQEKVAYNNLALVVTDEQHRFGVNQRRLLSKKNNENNVHVLVMSATPIPRTLAIILYGDLSVSIIDEVPAHKKPIKNAVVGAKFRNKTYQLMKDEIEKGHQCYVICPLVEESEGLDAKNVVEYAEELNNAFYDYGNIQVGILHGKMKPSEKQKVMNDFAEGNIQILVSTTVVEVGVNVPNATVMLIEDADRFGLAQLHQLRGRIGRGESQSYCVFMTENDNEKTMQRLNILKESNDGFKIASEDLKQRGPGDMFGIRQSGDMQFKIADIFSDALILKQAACEADRILLNDPELKMEEHSKLKALLEASFSANNIGQTL